MNGMIVPIREPMKPLYRRLADQIRARRESLRLTQQDLAELAGCSPRFVGALEAGKSSVRLDKLVDVLEALGIELRAARREP
jgi:HTH-type transcriptional regulator/antitoxin HipB